MTPTGGSSAIVLFLHGDELLSRGSQTPCGQGALGAPRAGAVPAQERQVSAAANPLPDVGLFAHRWGHALTFGRDGCDRWTWGMERFVDPSLAISY